MAYPHHGIALDVLVEVDPAQLGAETGRRAVSRDARLTSSTQIELLTSRLRRGAQPVYLRSIDRQAVSRSRPLQIALHARFAIISCLAVPCVSIGTLQLAVLSSILLF